jgi:hypothetical protein
MLDGAACVVLVPVLRRPHRVAPLVESLNGQKALFICSPDDHAEQEAVRAVGADLIVLDRQPAPGDYARKIQAGFDATTEPLVFLAADDLKFHPGWLEAAIAKLAAGIGVVGTNDLGSQRVMAGEHSTHSLVTREYVNRFGVIDQPGQVLHEGYPHEFVDDELVQTAMSRNAWAFAFDSHVEHLHPNWGKAPSDDLYAMQRKRMESGRRVYLRRKRLWT